MTEDRLQLIVDRISDIDLHIFRLKKLIINLETRVLETIDANTTELEGNQIFINSTSADESRLDACKEKLNWLKDLRANWVASI